MSIIDTDSARASRIRLAHLRQELLSPVNALLGYAEIMHEEASRKGRLDLLPDVNRVLRAARDLADKVGSRAIARTTRPARRPPSRSSISATSCAHP
jgi:signal transduction histidine kinase